MAADFISLLASCSDPPGSAHTRHLVMIKLKKIKECQTSV